MKYFKMKIIGLNKSGYVKHEIDQIVRNELKHLARDSQISFQKLSKCYWKCPEVFETVIRFFNYIKIK